MKRQDGTEWAHNVHERLIERKTPMFSPYSHSPFPSEELHNSIVVKNF